MSLHCGQNLLVKKTRGWVTAQLSVSHPETSTDRGFGAVFLSIGLSGLHRRLYFPVTFENHF